MRLVRCPCRANSNVVRKTVCFHPIHHQISALPPRSANGRPITSVVRTSNSSLRRRRGHGARARGPSLVFSFSRVRPAASPAVGVLPALAGAPALAPVPRTRSRPRPRLVSSFSAFSRSLADVSTPSSRRMAGHARMTSPRYASRPTYASSGRSRRNFASSSFHVAAPAAAEAPAPASGGPAVPAPCPPEAPAASASPLLAPELEPELPVRVELEPCPGGAPCELGPPLARCPLWMHGVGAAPTWDAGPRGPASALGRSPSEGCSAPGTSRTSRGRYHPSVHGFILHCTPNRKSAAAHPHARTSLSAIRWTHSVRSEEKFRHDLRQSSCTVPGHAGPPTPVQRTVAHRSLDEPRQGDRPCTTEANAPSRFETYHLNIPPQRCWRGGSCSGKPEAARRRGTKNGSHGRRHLAIWKCKKRIRHEDGRCVPEVEHLDIGHPPKYTDEEPRVFHPRADEGELAEAGQALERARVLDEVVV